MDDLVHSDGEPDPGSASTPAEFVDRLSELRRWAGEPSLRQLRRLAGRTRTPGGDLVDVLPVSTISHVLTGKTLPRMPRMSFVDSFVGACLTACGTPEDEQAARLSRWRTAWRGLAGGEAAHAAYRQLPMDIGEFTGRDAELGRLRELVAHADHDPAVTVVAIEGMGGVGKTRLAVHAAHGLVREGRFDGFQLWSDMRGFDPHQRPAEPADALEAFLRLLGVPGPRIPTNTAERAMLYRDRLAGRRGLVLLDNVAEPDQVLPLLPGQPGCLVLITTRRYLDLDGALHLPLDVFSPGEAAELLSRVAGRDRVRADPTGARRVAEQCGHLPLLLALTARRLRARPAWQLADLADLLAAHEEQGSTAASSFELSYQSLPPVAQRMFRLLGSHPGTDFTARSAAALAGLSVEEAGVVLETLLDEHLLQQRTAGRYRFHDLLRKYAGDLPDESRTEALGRCLTWLLHAVDNAVQTLEPNRRRTFELSTLDGEALTFGGHDEALGWLEAERATLVASVHAAAAAGLTSLSWQLPAVLLRFFYLRSHWADWLATHQVALEAVRESGDRRGEATVLNGLGVVYGDLHRAQEAIECCMAAADLFAELGHTYGQAWCLNNVGVTHIDHGDPAAAVDHLRRAIELFGDSGDPQGEALARNNLGDGLRLLGRPEEAIDQLRQALALQQESDPPGSRYTLGTLGDLYHDTDRHEEAVDYYERALALHVAVGDRRSVGRVRHSLGRALAALGREEDAREQLRQAHAILTELGDPEAASIQGA
ncbi:tetratricopeptide repeat protein [Actinophytocola sp.]|uniref:tetratricopeptide repeat protein n=1 Tax=Actinophytocola sp. TaxID=1872138 RepID=UPI003D6A89C6